LRTVDVQWQVAFLLLRTVIVEHHAVRAQFLRDLVVRALVVLVALVGVREETVRLRTLVLLLIGRFFVLNGGRPMTGRRRGRGSRPFPAAARGLAAQQSDCGNDSHIIIIIIIIVIGRPRTR